jgi:replicative DNA helicase
LSEAFDRIDELHREKENCWCGFKDLDNLLGGFRKSDLIILAARPSVGKTALTLDFARAAAVKYKVPVGFFH